LIVGTTDTPRLHLNGRTHVLQGVDKYLYRIAAAFLRDMFKSAIDNALGNRFLAARHDYVHELGNFLIVKFRIRQRLALRHFSTSWHKSSIP